MERIDDALQGPKPRILRDWSVAPLTRLNKVRKRRALPPAAQVAKELCELICEFFFRVRFRFRSIFCRCVADYNTYIYILRGWGREGERRYHVCAACCCFVYAVFSSVSAVCLSVCLVCRLLVFMLSPFLRLGILPRTVVVGGFASKTIQQYCCSIPWRLRTALGGSYRERSKSVPRGALDFSPCFSVYCGYCGGFSLFLSLDSSPSLSLSVAVCLSVCFLISLL